MTEDKDHDTAGVSRGRGVGWEKAQQASRMVTSFGCVCRGEGGAGGEGKEGQTAQLKH